MAMVAAKSAVMPPTQATTANAAGSAAAKSGKVHATIYTPAATIVAAWISALTGVGPSIAEGNHTCKGTCADLPIAPTNKQMHATVIADHSQPGMSCMV